MHIYEEIFFDTQMSDNTENCCLDNFSGWMGLALHVEVNSSSKMPRVNYSLFTLEGELKFVLATKGWWKAVAVSVNGHFLSFPDELLH